MNEKPNKAPTFGDVLCLGESMAESGPRPKVTFDLPYAPGGPLRVISTEGDLLASDSRNLCDYPVEDWHEVCRAIEAYGVRHGDWVGLRMPRSEIIWRFGDYRDSRQFTLLGAG